MVHKKPLKALLLAAGFGTRLGELTKKCPKCMMKIGDKPLLGLWLEKLEDLGCQEVLVNTHYLADQVESYINSFNKLSMKVSLAHEKLLLGTACTLLVNKETFRNSEVLFIHADNFTNLNFESFIEAHHKRNTDSLMSMVTFKTENPNSCGIVETDNKGIMIDFEEKPLIPKSNIANGAIYCFDDSFINYLDNLNMKFKLKDFSKDVIPLLKNKVQTWHTNDFIIDIGTPQQLIKAQSLLH